MRSCRNTGSIAAVHSALQNLTPTQKRRDSSDAAAENGNRRRIFRHDDVDSAAADSNASCDQRNWVGAGKPWSTCAVNAVGPVRTRGGNDGPEPTKLSLSAASRFFCQTGDTSGPMDVSFLQLYVTAASSHLLSCLYTAELFPAQTSRPSVAAIC